VTRQPEADPTPDRPSSPYCHPAADPLAPIRAHTGPEPFVVAQLGQSLDGRIATVTGDSRWINQSAALDHLHRLRAAVDVVVVGAGTIRADDPSLTVRRCSGRHPARAVIDTRARLPDEGKWLAENGAQRIVILSDQVRPEAGSAANAPHTTTLRLPTDVQGRIAPVAVARALAENGLPRILIEGGAWTVSNFLDADALDRLHLLVAPVLIGSGKTGLALQPIKQLSAARRPRTTVTPLTDGDVLFDCNLRETTEALDPTGD